MSEKKTKKSNTKSKYYSAENLIATNSDYNLIISGRSDGKTYQILSYIMKKYVESGYVQQGAYLRRYGLDFSPKNNSQLFAGLVQNGVVNELTEGKWNDVYYYSRRWYFCNYDEDGARTCDSQPFLFGFALNEMERDKGVSYPNSTTIFFDEFLTRSVELKNEWALFLNVLSTVIRDRNNVKIFMAANTVSKYSGYWENFGINIDDIPINTIRVYKMGKNEELQIAVEYYNSGNRKKDSNKYFCFDDPHVSMITSALWETDLFPHLPKVFNKKLGVEDYIDFDDDDIDFSFFIKFQNALIQCDWIDVDDYSFIFVHKKTTPIRHEDEDIVYCLDSDPRWNWIPNLMKNKNELSAAIRNMIIEGKVFFQSNTVGETFNKYLLTCGSSQVLTG